MNAENKSCGPCWGCMISKILVVIGGLNWGLVGLAMLLGKGNWNVVNLLLGDWPMAEAIVYLLVGIAAIMKMFSRYCRCHKNGGCCAPEKKM